MNERQADYFFYQGKKYQKLTCVRIEYNPVTDKARVVYFMKAYYQGDVCTTVVLYEQDNTNHGGHYIHMPYEKFISSIWRINSTPTHPAFIGLKENRPSLLAVPEIVVALTVFVIAMVIAILCKGGAFWCLGITAVFAFWLVRAIKRSIYYTRR